MPEPLDSPSWRKPVGMFFILALIFVWGILAMIFTPTILSL